MAVSKHILGFFTLLFAALLSCISASAQMIDIGKFVIDKNVCTITDKESGKTFNLYGNVRIVESSADLNVRIVEHQADLNVRSVEYTARNCGEFRFVESSADFTIRIVESAPDITIRFVESSSGINR